MREVNKQKPVRHTASHAQLVSGSNIAALLDILIEYWDITLSRSSYARAGELIVELGGAERLELDFAEVVRKS